MARTWNRGVAAAFLIAAAAWAQEPDIINDVRRDVRDDGAGEKLRLIEHAYQEGRFDLALSLTESLKDSLEFRKQLEGDVGTPVVRAEDGGEVADLPPAWAAWANGWSHWKAVVLREPIGQARMQEPVDFLAAFTGRDGMDLGRELRVARVEGAALSEVSSQVYGEVRRGTMRLCRIVFFADVPAHGEALYLILYGNPLAERPAYASGLRVEGDGYALTIGTDHYTAELSAQTGQMERIRFARQHGLELYAGGKGHGEPPTVDWSNDYVDEDHFQKLRIRNWAAPPNYEVVKGPLCVRVRRWGFPHSPIHPLFTPSRMHIDQTYVFYAGKDYFVKEGVMEAAKAFDLSTMRDDEWVLSGYSFTDPLWLDSGQRLREGTVPPEEAASLWGTGFRNRDGGDMFLALWLAHSGRYGGPLLRNGGPIMHYHQHGQLWSRSPLGGETPYHFDADSYLYQRNAYLVGAYPEEGAAAIEATYQSLANPLEAAAGALPAVADAKAAGTLARNGETPESAPLKPAIWEALREVWDEQLYRVDANAVDLGYIYDVSLRDGVAEVLMTMPHRGRPVYNYLVYQGGGRNSEGIRERLLHIEGIDQVRVRFTWDPPWTVSRLSDAGRRAMGLAD